MIDAEQCRLVSAGLDGLLHDARMQTFPTPATYDALIASAVERARFLMQREGVATLGMAISMPGLLDSRQGRGLLSPNVPLTNQHSPASDMAARLGIPCVVVQESHALCLAERHFGAAQDLDNFAVMDVSTGVGLGVMSGGRLLTGHSGLAGEIGHITVQLEGRPCGCGNRGCLETVASDSALAWRVSQRLGRRVTVHEILALMQSGELADDAAFQAELDETCRYLAVGLAAALNLFNPSTLFVHGKLFALDPTLFARLIDYTRARALPPAFADCCIVPARGSKRQGAIAAIIEHLTNAAVPCCDCPFHTRRAAGMSPDGASGNSRRSDPHTTDAHPYA